MLTNPFGSNAHESWLSRHLWVWTTGPPHSPAGQTVEGDGEWDWSFSHPTEETKVKWQSLSSEKNLNVFYTFILHLRKLNHIGSLACLFFWHSVFCVRTSTTYTCDRTEHSSKTQALNSRQQGSYSGSATHLCGLGACNLSMRLSFLTCEKGITIPAWFTMFLRIKWLILAKHLLKFLNYYKCLINVTYYFYFVYKFR